MISSVYGINTEKKSKNFPSPKAARNIPENSVQKYSEIPKNSEPENGPEMQILKNYDFLFFWAKFGILRYKAVFLELCGIFGIMWYFWNYVVFLGSKIIFFSQNTPSSILTPKNIQKNVFRKIF